MNWVVYLMSLMLLVSCASAPKWYSPDGKRLSHNKLNERQETCGYSEVSKHKSNWFRTAVKQARDNGRKKDVPSQQNLEYLTALLEYNSCMREGGYYSK